MKQHIHYYLCCSLQYSTILLWQMRCTHIASTTPQSSIPLDGLRVAGEGRSSSPLYIPFKRRSRSRAINSQYGQYALIPTQYDTVRHGTTQLDTVRQSTTPFDTVRHNTTQFDTVRHSSTRFDTVRKCSTVFDTF